MVVTGRACPFTHTDIACSGVEPGAYGGVASRYGIVAVKREGLADLAAESDAGFSACAARIEKIHAIGKRKRMPPEK